MSQHQGIVDFIATAPDGTVTLILIDDQAWDGSTERVAQVQQKITAYAAYAADGGLVHEHPELSGKPVRIELRCVHAPDPLTAHVLSAVQAVLRERSIGLAVKQIRPRTLSTPSA